MLVKMILDVLIYFGFIVTVFLFPDMDPIDIGNAKYQDKESQHYLQHGQKLAL